MTTGRVSLCIVAFVCLVGFGVHANSHRTPAQSSDARATTGPTARPRLLSTYGTLPARFEANRGQTDRRGKFLYRGRGYTLFLTATEAILSFKPLQAQCGRASHGAHEQPPVPQSGKSAADRALAPVRMSLVGANPAPEVTGLDRLPGIVNYFIGNDPKKSHTNISTYAMVRYKNVYPGIDLVYHSNHGQLKFDFAVAPGADFKAIRLRLDGGGKLKMDAKGNLVLAQTQGEVRFHKPYLYEVSHGQRHAVSGHYLLRSASQASFEVASYDKGRPLIIDPSLSYSTYLGSSHFDQGNGIAVDSMGNAYVTGFTRGTDTTFPIFPSGVYQTP